MLKFLIVQPEQKRGYDPIHMAVGAPVLDRQHCERFPEYNPATLHDEEAPDKFAAGSGAGSLKGERSSSKPRRIRLRASSNASSRYATISFLIAASAAWFSRHPLSR